MTAEFPETTYQNGTEGPDWREQFIYTATHELKTPLTSILGYIDLIQSHLREIQDNKELDELRYMFDVVARNTKRMEELINDVLEMRRIIDGRLETYMSRHDMAEFLDQVAEEMRPVLYTRDQHLLVESSVESLVFGRQRLAQVLQNLIQNSSKFSPDGSRIQLMVEKVDGAVRFSVSDEGMGLSQEDISKLFKPFPMIKKPGSHRGTGLGLSICSGIVELHGGKMWAESQGTGQGSTIFFTIPDNNQSK